MGKGKHQGEKDLKAFLRDLYKLSMRYDMEIWGCGECGSPAVLPLKSRERVSLLEHLTLCKECERYGTYEDHRDCKR